MKRKRALSLDCKQCGSAFEPLRWKGYEQQFCSGTCRNLAIPVHRAVMEQVLGRPLERYETVHHKNGVRHDSRPENLELWSSRHGRGQRVADLPYTIGSRCEHMHLAFGC